MMVRRWMPMAMLLLGAGVAIAAVSVMGEIKGAEAEAGSTAVVGWESSGETPMVEAELLNDGRTVLLLPAENEVLVRNGREIEPLDPTCVFSDGKFLTYARGHAERVWLFAVVAENKPHVSVEP